MILRFIFLFICLTYFPSLYSQSYNKKDDTEILESARAFYSAIELYSGKNGKEDKNLYGQILKYKDGDDAVFHANDLFGTRPRGQNFDNWMTYLDNIDNDYENNIEVSYSDVQLLNCFETRNGFNCAIVSVKKSLKYKDNYKTETEFILINLNSKKISEVVFPDFYTEKGGTCNSPVESNRKEKQIETRREADRYFEQKNYSKAKELYTSIKEDFSDATVNSKIDECNKFLSLENYLKEADNAFTNKKYDAAKSLYLKILNEFPQADKLPLNEKIKQCNQEINEQIYRRNIEYGDYYFQKGIYNQARSYYQLALQVKAGDQYATNRYNEAKKDDPNLALQEIRKAVDLAESGKKNYGKAFKIMSEYEQSNLLTTENYYFLTVMMFKRFESVRDEMNYSKKDCDNYLNIYVKKLKEKNSRNPYPEATFLIEEVINKRYQK